MLSPTALFVVTLTPLTLPFTRCFVGFHFTLQLDDDLDNLLGDSLEYGEQDAQQLHHSPYVAYEEY